MDKKTGRYVRKTANQRRLRSKALKALNMYEIKKDILYKDMSLKDMVEASRIVVEYKATGLIDETIGSSKAKRLANNIISHHQKTNKSHRDITIYELDQAILERNAIEHPPTEKTVALYKKLFSDD